MATTAISPAQKRTPDRPYSGMRGNTDNRATTTYSGSTSRPASTIRRSQAGYGRGPSPS